MFIGIYKFKKKKAKFELLFPTLVVFNKYSGNN